MLHKTDRDREAAFLEEIADKFKLKDKTRLVFIERFKVDNDDLTNQALADVLSDNLLQNASKKAIPDIVLRDCLSKTIFKKLEAEGCDFNGANRDKVEIAKRWLREVAYPWYQLKNTATFTDKMGPRIQEISKMDMWQSDSDYPHTIPLGSKIKFEVKLERPGYLTLLEKGTSGKLYCLSPSFFAPAPHFNQTGVASLPQEGARINSFKLTGKPGVEEIVAAIAPQRPKLDWLPKPDQRPLLLQGKHLQEFLAYFQGKSDCTLWYMDYQVV